MFESFVEPGSGERFRSAAIVPLAAFILVQLYSVLASLLLRVPPWLFWTSDALSLAGGLWGLGAITHVLRTKPPAFDRQARVWLVLGVVLSCLCLFTAATLTFPWI